MVVWHESQRNTRNLQQFAGPLRYPEKKAIFGRTFILIDTQRHVQKLDNNIKSPFQSIFRQFQDLYFKFRCLADVNLSF